jgi:ribosomal protein L7/L12
MRIGRLEQLVDHLYAHLGITPPPLASGISERVRAIALDGNMIAAIKAHREETGKDLATAKAEIEGLL